MPDPVPEPAVSAGFIRAIPKTDLHVHLDGSLRLSTLIELARAAGVRLPSASEAGLRETVFKPAYANLPEYLAGFTYTVAVMQRADHIERIAYELAADNLAEGVRYLEVRFAPQLHIHPELTAREVVASACRGLERARAEHNRSAEVRNGRDVPFHFGLILCALRWFVPAMSTYYRSLYELMSYAGDTAVYAMASLETARLADALAHREGLPVVGFDLAGAEAGYPAEDHQDAFLYAHRHFVKKTVHAGEAYGPESIFQAITQCHANRIGHGTQLFETDAIQDPAIEDREAYVRHLAEYIASQRIAIEVCLTSNLQTLPHLAGVGSHPLSRMLDRNLSVSICTDNRLVSDTTVCRELQRAATGTGMTAKQFRNIILAGFKGSFFPGSYNEKRAYVRQVIDRYDLLAAQFGLTPRPGTAG